jgi:hypothetical protein
VRGERLAWLVTVPIAAIGSESAHAITNALLGAPDGDHGELLTGRTADLVPLLASLALAAVALGLAAGPAGRWTGRRAAVARLPFALLAPGLFVLQEHAETALYAGAGAAAGTVFEPTFLPGLVLQIPFAILGYAVARALVRLADGIRALVLRRGPQRRRAAGPIRTRTPLQVLPPAEAHRWAHSGRAPPAVAAARA